jgi:hypothetical protein
MRYAKPSGIGAGVGRLRRAMITSRVRGSAEVRTLGDWEVMKSLIRVASHGLKAPFRLRYGPFDSRHEPVETAEAP